MLAIVCQGVYTEVDSHYFSSGENTIEVIRMNEEDKKNPKPKLSVKVQAPRSAKPKRFKWKPQMLVGAAAEEAAAAFGYAPGKTTLSLAGRVLDPGKSLKAEGVRDGATLELVDVGGGV